jgi:hypothetical protein
MRNLSAEEICKVAGGRMANSAMLSTGIRPDAAPAGTPCINPSQAQTVVAWSRSGLDGAGAVAGAALATYVVDGFDLSGVAANSVIGAGTWAGEQIGNYAGTQLGQQTVTAYQQVVNTWDYAMGLFNSLGVSAQAASWYNMSYQQACNDSQEYMFGL